ncbi:hypothetical protein SAMN05421774_10869 [Gemmobacter megaterium]|uniref:Uncharacterized protein n=1 Tax=Gemmobacter megaterium TaxID=1086013 RepID=A0A1N7QB76_9RHOB|nr:hypothetical protein [Gemmobacter megaterium]GGE24206.1 hypothetical protein GCM10011345_32750 [Gemmobacter megaterium]SIT20054.1 hypothetical protein SAMN05421774_10869 [Gemmobacter megaterium]
MTEMLIPRAMIEAPALDLRRRHFDGERNGIVVVGSWIRTDASPLPEPCMVLLHPLRPIARGRTVPVVIPLSEAWRWAAHGDVGDPEHCGARTFQWLADGLLPGNAHSPRDRLRVLDTINHYLPDLLSMPPAPALDRRRSGPSFGEIKITNTVTGETRQSEISRDV